MAEDFLRRNSKVLFIGVLLIILFDIVKGQSGGRFGRNPRRQWGTRSSQGQIPRSFLRQPDLSGFGRSFAPSNARSTGRSSFFWNDNSRIGNNLLNDPLSSMNQMNNNNNNNNNNNLQPQVIRIPAPRLSEVRVPGIQRTRNPSIDSRRGPVRIVSRQNNPRQSSAFSGRSPMSSQQQQFMRSRELSRQSSPIIGHARMRQNGRRLGNGLPRVMQRTSSRMTSRDYIPQVIRIPLNRFNPSRSVSPRQRVSTRQRFSPEVQVRRRDPTKISVERRPEVRQSIQTKSGLARPQPKVSSQPATQETVNIKQLPVQTAPQTVVTGAQQSTVTLVQPQTVVSAPVQPQTVVSAPVQPQTVVSAPVQPQTVIYAPVQPQIVVSAPVQPHTVISAPVQPHTVVSAPVQPQIVKAAPVQIQTVVHAPAVQQTGSTVGTSGTPDLIFEELVNAFTDVLQQPTGQQSGVLAPAPVVHNQHPQTMLQNSLLVAQQPMGVQQHGMLHQGQLQPQLGSGMLHQGHMMGNPMFGGHMGMMNPWMMGRMNPAMMQEMMFGDTTDPPDPVPTTTVAPATTAAPVIKVTEPVIVPVVPVIPAAVDAPVIIVAEPASALPTVPPTVTAPKVPTAPVIVESPKTTAAPIVEAPGPTVPQIVEAPKAAVMPIVEAPKPTILTIVEVQKPTLPPVVEAPKPTLPPKVETPKQTAPPVMETVVTELSILAAESIVPVTPEAAPVVVDTVSTGVADAVSHVEVTVDVHAPPHPVVAEPTQAPKSMEEKIMAEVARMLLNQSVDMSLLSQVVGKVAAEMQVIEPEIGPEVAPSASLLGLTTPGPLTTGSKLSKKEKVKQLIGSTRGIVIYPPTAPTIVHTVGIDTSPVVVETRPLYDVNKVRFSDKFAPATIPPHADIPTLPPPKDKSVSNPDIYRTLETILNHDPASIIKVMQEQSTPATVATTAGPKISIKSLVDIGQLHNFTNLESILTDISNVKTVDLPQNITYLNSITNGTDYTIVTGPVDLLTGGLESLSTSAIESILNSTQHNLNVEPLVKSTYIPPVTTSNGVKLSQIEAHAIHVEPITATGSDVTTVPTDVTDNVAHGNAGASVDMIAGNQPVQPKLANVEGIPVFHVERLPEVTTAKLKLANVEVTTAKPKLANMEGIPVFNVERIPELTTAANHVTKSTALDVSGALGILEEIRNFKPTSGSSASQTPKHDLASKLSDPNVVKQLRELLKSMMKKTGSQTSTASAMTSAPLPEVTTTIPEVTTTIPEVTTTIPEMTTMTFPAFSTGEYEEYMYMTTTGVY